ncbi:glutathione-disulfide reductase [Gammaproteobacteria bacterium 42_54_T18]|nr:glutathione-disulfide reductase [Gammaproteobacteria bacterium 42_54_T18]
MSYQYDLFVIGAGSGGVRAARMAATEGAKVAVAEKQALGGTCVNVGCVPKKLFVYGSHISEEIEAAEGFGWSIKNVSFDWDILRDNKTREIERLNGIYGDLLDNAGVDLVVGEANIVSPHEVKVGDTVYTAKNILVATGSTPFIPEFPGSELAVDSNHFFYMETLPKKAIVVGGGYIAVEFAGILNGFGVETHLIYRGPLFLRGFDTDIREFVRDELLKKGIHLHFDTNIETLTKSEDGRLIAQLGSSQIDADMVLYATGRRPLIDNLGLEAVGVKLRPNASIIVDDYYQTSVSSIYAIGDVIGRLQLTPVALAEGMAIVDNLVKGQKRKVDYLNIATAVFCQPNIGTVGLTAEDAEKQYPGDITLFTSDFKHMKHTLSGLDERTYMKLVVQTSTDKVLGAHMVGSDAGEIVQGLAIALKCGATKAQFDSTIGIHPTAAEEFVTMRTPTSA